MKEDQFSTAELRKAALALSERYRKGEKPFLRTRQDRYAYVLTRLPATQAAIKRVFQEIQTFPLQTLLDIGAGPGTSWGAVCEIWGSIQATFVERDRDFVEIGSKTTPADRVKWVTGEASTFSPHDLVLFSYSWGEIDDLSVLAHAWKAARSFLVVIEPGTPRGYEKMLKARDWCIDQGGFVAAPCPHSKPCPWMNTQEWCHFGVRLERDEEHRLAKEGSLGFEDEKFSYVIMAKQPVVSSARLLRDPMKRKGHTLITVCAENGIETLTVTKSSKKKINKLKWGDKISSELLSEPQK